MHSVKNLIFFHSFTDWVKYILSVTFDIWQFFYFDKCSKVCKIEIFEFSIIIR